MLSFSFFITKKMKTELSDGRLTGTLPILYTFLARSGKAIRETTLVSLNADGTVTPLEGALAKGASPGAKIEFTAADGGLVQTLYYFNTDLSNGGIKHSGFLAFCKGLGQADSFVKSASYLMHSDNFSAVRDFIVQNTATLVQDDFGCSDPLPRRQRLAVDGVRALSAADQHLSAHDQPGQDAGPVRERVRSRWISASATAGGRTSPTCCWRCAKAGRGPTPRSPEPVLMGLARGVGGRGLVNRGQGFA